MEGYQHCVQRHLDRGPTDGHNTERYLGLSAAELAGWPVPAIGGYGQFGGAVGRQVLGQPNTS